jgi:transposase, IS30 family
LFPPYPRFPFEAEHYVRIKRVNNLNNYEKKYSHINKHERNEIVILLSKKYSFRDIARALNRSVSSISEEINNNSVKGIYDPFKANLKAYVRRYNASYRGQKIVRNKELRDFVEINLLDEQSPSAISGRIKYHEKHLPNVSKNTIYDFLDGPYGKIIKGIRKKRKYRQKRLKVKQLKDRVFIEKRPKIAEKRGRVGDCEGDFIVSGRSGKGYLLVVVDRKIRTTFIEQILDISIDNVHSAFQRIKDRFPEMKTLTLDNDILFRMHQTLEILLNIPIYFCYPYHSYEKGTVENTNKYIRKYVPKGSDISQYDQDYISTVEQKCNQRFMKCLKYSTPQEKLEKYRLRIKKQHRCADEDKK